MLSLSVKTNRFLCFGGHQGLVCFLNMVCSVLPPANVNKEDWSGGCLSSGRTWAMDLSTSRWTSRARLFVAKTWTRMFLENIVDFLKHFQHEYYLIIDIGDYTTVNGGRWFRWFSWLKWFRSLKWLRGLRRLRRFYNCCGTIFRIQLKEFANQVQDPELYQTQ